MDTVTIVVVGIWNGLLLGALGAVIVWRELLLEWVTGADLRERRNALRHRSPNKARRSGESGLDGDRWRGKVEALFRFASRAAPASVSVAWMDRLLTVEFGPSRSKRFGKALDEARRLARECSEVEPGKYRANFLLGTDSADYTGLARLLERVRHWRATEVCEGDEPVSAYHAKEMAWCASSQLKSYGACRFRFVYGVFPRCSLCPLFDAERAIRDVLGENPPAAMVFEIRLGPTLRALLQGEDLTEGSDLDSEVPDFVQEGWADPRGDEPAG